MIIAHSANPLSRPQMTNKGGSQIPSAFISYSHDSEAHKDWVKSLADRLKSDGIEVIFDQHDLRIAMSPSTFMEESLAVCDRVLLIITGDYTIRSDNLSGGVGYERMIITAEMAKNLKTVKFIPVLRGGDSLPAFLGDRIYVDARNDENWSEAYEQLLTELQRPLKLGRPSPSAAHPQGSGVVIRLAGDGQQDALHDEYHWSHLVHSHAGNTLYLIFLKFAESSIKPRPSVIQNLSESGITDYSTFHLYANQDLLIRAWANKESIELLRAKLADNRDLDPRTTPEFMEANGVHHFPDEMQHPIDDTALTNIVSDLTWKQIKEIQTGGSDSAFEKKLIDIGLRIKNSVRFSSDRIQFYIIIRTLKLDSNPLTKLLKKVREFSVIKNKTVYLTSGTATEAVIKGQVEKGEYYEINTFLESITDALENFRVSTETILVASPSEPGSGRIDPSRAERHLLDQAFRRAIGNTDSLPPPIELLLRARFAEAEPIFAEDPRDILVGLIRARAKNGQEEFESLRTFFANLESTLQANFFPVLVKLFGSKSEEERNRIMMTEKIEAGRSNRLQLGDSLKIYRRLVEEYGIISIDPLSGDEFRKLMQRAPEIRNSLAHGVLDLTSWEELFLFFKGFVRIDSRLRSYFSGISS